MSRKYFFANWKMYLNQSESVELAEAMVAEKFDMSKIAMTVFPSALALSQVREIFEGSGLGIGAQNVHWIDKGGYTGEISAAMFKEAGASYALVGHSERRYLGHETNTEVRHKIEAILAEGMTPVVCIGETQAEHRDGAVHQAVEAQLRAAFEGLAWPEGRELIVAYEPVWAVGTGTPCPPEQVQATHELVKRLLNGLITTVEPVLLYGGSVRVENVAHYLSSPLIKGVLVSGASVKVETWRDIVAAGLTA